MMCDFRAVMDYICIAFVSVREADQTAALIRGEDPGIEPPSCLTARVRSKSQTSGFDPASVALLRSASCREEGLPVIWREESGATFCQNTVTHLQKPAPLPPPSQWLAHYVSAAASCVLTGPGWKPCNVLRGDTLLILTRLSGDQTFLYVGR